MRSVFHRRAGAVCLALALGGCASSERAPRERLPVRHAVHEAREELSGTVVTGRRFLLQDEIQVTVAGPDSAAAERALAAGFAAADSVEGLLGSRRSGSEIQAINAAAGKQPVVVSPWTERVLAAALDWAEKTGGAFDPTVGPLLEVWGFGNTTGMAIDSTALERARSLVGWDRVVLDQNAHTVYLPNAGMGLELGAAIKGFALDRMMEAMESAGATAGIADIGGDIAFFGRGTESSRDRWPIDIPDPFDPEHAFARLEVPPGGLSTSQSYGRQVEVGGERIGDLINPATGRPSEGIASVTVYARDAFESDLLSTALFVLGPGRGRALVEATAGVDVIFVLETGPGQESRIIMTAGIRPYLKELHTPYRPADVEDR